MAFSRPDFAVLTPQRILLIIGLVALLLVPTGAFVVNQGAFDAFGPEDEIILQPYDGPNGQYAEINSNDELVVNITDAGVNPNAVTDIDRIFIIGNTGSDQKQVWITHDNRDVLTFYNEETGEPIGEDNNVTLGPNESVTISLRVDTTGDVQVGETLEATLIVHARIFNTPELELRGDPDFGQATNGTTTTREVSIRNNGTAPLAVEDISINGQNASEFVVASGGDVSRIAPGESSTVEVQFAPTAPGNKSATLDVSTNDTEIPTATIALSGQSVEPGLSVVGGAETNFGEVRTGATERKTITIRNNGPTQVPITGRDLAGDRPGPYTVVTDGLPGSLAAGETREVTIEFTPTTTGWKNASLSVTAPGAQDDGVTIELTGFGTDSALNVEPVPIAFDPIAKNQTAYKTVTISNRGAAELDIDTLELAGSDADQFGLDTSETRETIPSGQNTTVNISFTPTRAEKLSTKLEITSDDGDESTKSIAVTGEGLGPEINTSPDSVDFGTVAPDEKKSLNVTIENFERSPTDLTVKSTRILSTGPDSNSDLFEISRGAPPYTLEPGETRDLELTYDPNGSTAPATAQLRILSDAVNSPQIDVWLSTEGWRILVREVPPRDKGIDGDNEEQERQQTGQQEALDPDSVRNDSKRVEMDVNDMPSGRTLDINVSQPATRQAAVASEKIRFTTNRGGSFDINFLHNRKSSPAEGATEYTIGTDEEIVQYIQLAHDIDDSAIQDPTFTYRVRKDKLSEGTTRDEVVFRRLENGEWETYDTTFLRETRSHYFFEVDLPGLSQFVITAPNETETPPPPTDGGGGNDGSSDDDGDSGGGGGDGDSGGAQASGPNTETTPSAPSTPDAPSTQTPGAGSTLEPGTPAPETPAPQTPTTPIIDTGPEQVTVEQADTEITFPGLTDATTSDGQNLQDVISVEDVGVPPPGRQGRDGPRAAIGTRSAGGEAEAVISGGEGVELRLAREERAVRRIEAKGADAMTLVQRPIPLTGSHSLFRSKDAIDDNWRMIRRVNITVPPEYEDRSAIIRIRVPREQFGNTSPENATIARNNDGWQVLDTSVAERTDEMVILEAETPGFSTFAVFADNGVSYSWAVETYDEPLTGPSIDPEFDDVGIYNATLTVTDSFGLEDTARYRILVNDIPEVTIETLGPVAENETVVLEATATDEFGNVTYNWTLPNGTTVNGTDRVRYTFREGEQTVRVAAIDEFGARGTDEATYTVGTEPALSVNVLSRNFRVGWPVVLLGLLVIPLVVLLRMGLLRLDHPPAIEVFEKPRIDLEDNEVIIPRLRVADSGADLDRIAVSLLDYEGEELARESGSIGGDEAYEAENVWIRANPDLPLSPGGRYAVEVRVTDAAENETLRARSVEPTPGAAEGDGFDDGDGGIRPDEFALEDLEAEGEITTSGDATTDEADGDEVDTRNPDESHESRGVGEDAPGASVDPNGGAPAFAAFGTPRIDLGEQEIVVPGVRVVDGNGDLTLVTVTVLDDDGHAIGRHTERLDDAGVYHEADLRVGTTHEGRFEPGATYVVRIQAMDADGNRTIRSQTATAPDGRGSAVDSSRDRDGLSPAESGLETPSGAATPFVYPYAGDVDAGSEFIYPYGSDATPVATDARKWEEHRHDT